jgi:transposase InsO family protein
VDHKRVERLIRIRDIAGHTHKKRTVTTIPYAAHRVADLVQRNLTPGGLDQLWAGDITYISTWEGFLYLAVVEDLASRRIVGMSMAGHMRASLVGDAMEEAVGTRRGSVASTP